MSNFCADIEASLVQQSRELGRATGEVRGYLAWRLFEPDQVHLDPEILHQELPGHPAHGVEGVVGVGVGGARQEKISVRVSINLFFLTLFLSLHKQSFYPFSLEMFSFSISMELFYVPFQ